ncbi:hypothetical protein PF008_g27875 [Phytophthora fragariae]|uniref:Uncharacterized protein n=1 Tax=Phytophthora fragariae TaxID=53985 RepID=A0A6G0QCW9_9STRA|nr:hypothetical protein PF008_g27875 [Phytophthora fragariae]
MRRARPHWPALSVTIAPTRHFSSVACISTSSSCAAIAIPWCSSPAGKSPNVSSTPNSASWQPSKWSFEIFCHTSDRRLTQPFVVFFMDFSAFMSTACTTLHAPSRYDCPEPVWREGCPISPGITAPESAERKPAR